MDKFYVTMTDKFMSGWGMAEDKINKLVFECKDFKEAQIVRENAEVRPEMIYINICEKIPYYKQSAYYTSFKTKNEASYWYERH